MMSAQRAYKKTRKVKKSKAQKFFNMYIMPTIEIGLYSYTVSEHSFSDELVSYFRKKGYTITYDPKAHSYTIYWGNKYDNSKRSK